jgi:hypothetical protein
MDLPPNAQTASKIIQARDLVALLALLDQKHIEMSVYGRVLMTRQRLQCHLIEVHTLLGEALALLTERGDHGPE